MPKLTQKVPKLRAKYGRAVVTLNGKDHYLGVKAGTVEAKACYDALIARWLQNNREPAFTIVELQPTITEVLYRPTITNHLV